MMQHTSTNFNWVPSEVKILKWILERLILTQPLNVTLSILD